MCIRDSLIIVVRVRCYNHLLTWLLEIVVPRMVSVSLVMTSLTSNMVFSLLPASFSIQLTCFNHSSSFSPSMWIHLNDEFRLPLVHPYYMAILLQCSSVYYLYSWILLEHISDSRSLSDNIFPFITMVHQ